MTTSTDPSELGTEQAEGEQQQGGNPLRKQYEEALAQIKTLKEQVRKGEFRRAGFDPDAEQGPGALLWKAYDGEADAEAIRSYAEQYGITPPSADGTESNGSTTPPELPPEEQERQQAQARLSRLQSASESGTQTQTHDQKIAAAEAKAKETNDWSEFMRLQAESLLAPR